jgi:hypothetical protein
MCFSKRGGTPPPPTILECNLPLIINNILKPQIYTAYNGVNLIIYNNLILFFGTILENKNNIRIKRNNIRKKEQY